MKLEDFTRGWIVGDFDPAIVKTKDVEIGILYFKEGECADNHFHKNHTEWNLVLEGCARSKGHLYFADSVFIFNPNEEADVEYIMDTRILVIKSPATKDDKYYA